MTTTTSRRLSSEIKSNGDSILDTSTTSLNTSMEGVIKKKRRLFDKTTQILDDREFTTEVKPR